MRSWLQPACAVSLFLLLPSGIVSGQTGTSRRLRSRRVHHGSQLWPDVEDAIPAGQVFQAGKERGQLLGAARHTGHRQLSAADAQINEINSPWFRFFLSYDPRPTLMKVRVPVLALNGEKDAQEQVLPFRQ